MSNDLEKLDLPPMDQVGFVVPDMDTALQLYEPMFGPFNRMDTEVEQADFRGNPTDCTLKLAFGKSGDVEIELIEITSGNSPHQEFIDAGKSGMQHIRFRVEDCDAKIEEAKIIGYQPIWYKRLSDDIAFVYLEREGDPLIIEFLQMP